MKDTKARHLEIYNAAVKVLDNAGGIQVIDRLPQSDRVPQLRRMAKWITEATDCHISSAKRNLAKALRRARFSIMKTREIKSRWGGERPGAGRPPAE